MATRTIAIVSTGRARRYRRAPSPVVLTLQRIRQDRLIYDRLIYDKKLDERPGGRFRCNQLSHAHIICLCLVGLGSLLVALFAVTVGQGAPLAMMSQEAREARRLVSVAKWKNPCGFAAEELADDDVEVVQLDDATLLGNIVMQAKTALNYAQNVRDDYIKRTFGTDFKDLHLTWKDNHYDWLPGLAQIPKQLGEPLGLDYLDKLDVRMLDNALLNVYEYLQRYAVGLEQVAWDQQDNALAFQQEFKDMENHLRSVLCEVQMALAERNVPQREDIDRDIMPEEYRNMWTSATYRNLRDWLIYRDYMNGLEYIVEVFDHLISQIQRTSV